MREDLYSEESIGLLLFPQPVNKDWQIVVIVQLVNIHLPSRVIPAVMLGRQIIRAAVIFVGHVACQ